MDALLQLFSQEEILERIARKQLTGALHVFTLKESANVFFQNGTVVAAAKGLFEGDEVLKQVLSWADSTFLWQPDVAPPATSKALQIDMQKFLGRGTEPLKPAEASRRLTPDAPAEAPTLIKIGSKAPATGPVRQSLPSNGNNGSNGTFLTGPIDSARAPVELTATKNINPTPQTRSAQEEALLGKYRLALTSVENPATRLRIARVSSLIGRNPACDLPLDHPSISRQHCLLQLTDRGLHVKDLGTTNGTKVNGIALTEGYINVGDKLSLGHLAFVLEKDALPLVPEPEPVAAEAS